jgi:hypothetical protein
VVDSGSDYWEFGRLFGSPSPAATLVHWPLDCPVGCVSRPAKTHHNLCDLVEVSDSTLDFATKAQTYGKAGILEYWVIDVAGRNLYVLRQPNGDRYGTEIVLKGGDRVSSIAFPEVAIEVDRLLAPT